MFATGTVLATAMTVQALLATTPALAQTPDCGSAGNSGECRTEWNEDRPSSGVGHRNQRDGKSTYIATGNIGSAQSPANIANITVLGRSVSGGYIINKIDPGETVLNNSARIYLKPTTDSPNGALAISRTGNAGAATYVTNEQDGFLNADNGIWMDWHRSRRANNARGHYDHVISATNEGTIEARQVGVTVHHHDFFGDIQISERGTITAGETGIQAIGGDSAVVTVAGTARITSDGDGVRRTARAGGTVTVEAGATITAARADGSERWGVNVAVDPEPDNPAHTLTAAQKSVSVDVAGVVDSGHGGIGIQNDGPGTTMVEVIEGGSVTGAETGIRAFGSGTGAVTVEVAGTVSGEGSDAIRVDLGGTTTVTLRNDFQVVGRIKLNGAGLNDDLVLEVPRFRRGDVLGDIEGISRLAKWGEGTAYLAGDVSLADGGAVTLHNGALVLRGHVDLGETGAFTVTSDTRLTIEVGPGNDDHGRITAGTITIPAGTPVHVALAYSGRTAAAGRLKSGITAFDGGGATATEGAALVFDGYGSVTGHTVGESGSIRYDLTSLSPDPIFGSGEGESGGGAGGGGTVFLVVGGVQSFLAWSLFDQATPFDLADTDQRPATAMQGFALAPSGIQSGGRGIEYRAQLLEHGTPTVATTVPVSGVATSLRAHLGGGFHADLSGVPNLALSSGRDSHSGNRYGLGLGWRAGAFSTDIGFSRTTLETRSTYSNLAGLGVLSGTYGQRHDQLQANAKLRLRTKGLTFSPSLSLYGGELSGERYTASSPVWLAEVPSVTQNYSGWMAGMTVAPRSGLEAMGLRWRPELRLTTARLADGGGEDLEIAQRDRAGAIRLQTRARTDLPRRMHALGGGLTVAGGADWSLRGGYVAMLADDSLEHVAVAGLRMRF